MSKHNHYQNYQNYQNKENRRSEPTTTYSATTVYALDQKLTGNESTVELTTQDNTIKGVVFNCSKLNVRSEPNPNGDVLCQLKVDMEVFIDEEKSSRDFYKIYTATGVEGYCMKNYIAVD